MKRSIIPILVAVLSFALAACTQDINSLDERVSTLEKGRVATVEEQVSAIQASIEKLSLADADLKSYLVLLQGMQERITDAYESVNARVDALKKSLETEAADCSAREAALKAELLGELEAYKQEMSGTLVSVNAAMASLQDKDKEIEGKITSLQSFVETQISGTKDWASKTFATLEQLSEVSATVAGLKAALAALDLDDVDARMKSMYKDCETAISKAVDALDAKLSASITACQESVAACVAAVAAAKEENTKAISEAVTALEASLKEWVGTQLSGYCTIDQADARLDIALDSLNRALKSQKAYCDGAAAALRQSLEADEAAISALVAQSKSLEDRIAANENDIMALKSSLSSLREELTGQYQSAITEAVTALEGRLSDYIDSVESKLASEITAVNTSLASLVSRVTSLEDGLQELKNRFASIEAEFQALKDKLNALVEGIRSISFVPAYSDGRVAVNYVAGETLVSRSDEMLFKISPAEQLPILKELYEKSAGDVDVLTVRAVKTLTRAGTEFYVLPVLTAEFDEASATVAVTVDCSPLGVSYPANAVLDVTDGASAISSDYVPLFSEDYIVSYTTTDSKPVNVTANSDKVLYNAYDVREGGIVIFDKSYDASAVDLYKGTFASSNLKSVMIPDVALLCEGCFNSCYSLESVTLPSGTAVIPDLCFNACESLKDFVFPSGLTEVGIQAFKGCKLLDIAKIPSTLKSIRNFAFVDCTGISGALDLVNVEHIGDSAFYGCSGLESVIGGNVSTISETAFYDCSKLASIYFGHLNSLGRSAFNRCSSLSSANLGGSLTSIPENAFYNCTSLKSFTVPYTVRTIESKAFFNCSSLQALNSSLSNPVYDKIGSYSFYGCAFKDLELNVTFIDEYAFGNNPVDMLTLGPRTAYIGDNAFSSTLCAMTVIINAQNPPQIGQQVWNSKYLTSITTPDAAVYKAASGWSVYADKIK